jgi:hypothetical protein
MGFIYGSNWYWYRFYSGGKVERVNGAYYYMLEIERNIIPYIKTTRNWVLTNLVPYRVNTDHNIVFIHSNEHPEVYDWLTRCKDTVLICGIPETCEKVAHLGRPVYLPLSIDVADTQQYAREKDRDLCYAGRHVKIKPYIPPGADVVTGRKRSEFLKELSRYKRVAGVGRVALEALALGAEIVPYDPRFPDPSRWQLLDNSEAVPILQHLLDEIDGGQ